MDKRDEKPHQELPIVIKFKVQPESASRELGKRDNESPRTWPTTPGSDEWVSERLSKPVKESELLVKRSVDSRSREFVENSDETVRKIETSSRNLDHLVPSKEIVAFATGPDQYFQPSRRELSNSGFERRTETFPTIENTDVSPAGDDEGKASSSKPREVECRGTAKVAYQRAKPEEVWLAGEQPTVVRRQRRCPQVCDPRKVTRDCRGAKNVCRQCERLASKINDLKREIKSLKASRSRQFGKIQTNVRCQTSVLDNDVPFCVGSKELRSRKKTEEPRRCNFPGQTPVRTKTHRVTESPSRPTKDGCVMISTENRGTTAPNNCQKVHPTLEDSIQSIRQTKTTEVNSTGNAVKSHDETSSGVISRKTDAAPEEHRAKSDLTTGDTFLEHLRVVDRRTSPMQGVLSASTSLDKQHVAPTAKTKSPSYAESAPKEVHGRTEKTIRQSSVPGRVVSYKPEETKGGTSEATKRISYGTEYGLITGKNDPKPKATFRSENTSIKTSSTKRGQTRNNSLVAPNVVHNEHNVITSAVALTSEQQISPFISGGNVLTEDAVDEESQLNAHESEKVSNTNEQRSTYCSDVMRRKSEDNENKLCGGKFQRPASSKYTFLLNPKDLCNPYEKSLTYFVSTNTDDLWPRDEPCDNDLAAPFRVQNLYDVRKVKWRNIWRRKQSRDTGNEPTLIIARAPPPRSTGALLMGARTIITVRECALLREYSCDPSICEEDETCTSSEDEIEIGE